LSSAGGSRPARTLTWIDGRMSVGTSSVASRAAHGHELVRGDPVAHMDVVRALLRHRGLPLGGPRCGRVVVADIHRRLGWQVEQPLHRCVQLVSVAPGKVGARAAQVRHEERVADERRAADEVRHVGRRVSRHEQGGGFNGADAEGLAVLEQMVELAAIGQEAALQVVELLEGGLHHADVLADCNAPADPRLKVAGRRQVIGMRMGLQDPFDLQAVLGHARQHPVGAGGAGVARLEVVVEHRVDDGGLQGGRVPCKVGHGSGLGVEEGLDGGGRVHWAPRGSIGRFDLWENILYIHILLSTH
jgi:hypothetical protein